VVFEPREFSNDAGRARYKAMIQELRCLVCQNQNIADSNAPLAQDLRREVYRMIEAGNTDDEIVDFMVTRYGDFVLYRPPLKGVTLALWLGPAALGLIGVAVLLRALRRRREQTRATERPLSDEERARLQALTGGDGREAG
jgi:cytochrome c-type biogenesis protein CcmH